MKEKFLNELPEPERLRIGDLVRNIATNYRELLTTFYVYENQNGAHVAVGRRIENADEIIDSFIQWAKGVRSMEEKFLNELPESERLRIGELVKGIAVNYRELLNIFYVYEDQNGVNVAIDRKIQSAEEIMDSFMAWTKGDCFEFIGDSIFQSGGAIPEEIFKTVGITEDNEDAF